MLKFDVASDVLRLADPLRVAGYSFDERAHATVMVRTVFMSLSTCSFLGIAGNGDQGRRVAAHSHGTNDEVEMEFR